MIESPWHGECKKTLICVDSYNKGILAGRFYNSYQDAESFDSLSQFLKKMENLLNEQQMPQAYTATRSFGEGLAQLESRAPPAYIRKGARATFELQVIFRQHTSWQGIIVWMERQWEQSFRSVLELVFLIDSALCTTEGSGFI